MLVTLIGRNSMLYKIALPKTPVGNYWLSDNSGEEEKKLINIEGFNGNWQISSNNFVRIVNPKWVNRDKQPLFNEEKYLKYINLKEYSMYYISFYNSDELFILYCSPISEENFIQMKIKNTTEIIIGNNNNNDISYMNPLVKNKHARIYFYNGRCYIENFDLIFGTFVNNKPIHRETKILFNGDEVFIMGLRIIVLGKKLIINNPLGKMSYNRNNLMVDEITVNKPQIIQKDEEEIDSFQENEYFARAPRITNVIEKEKVKIDPPPAMQDKEGMPLIYILGSVLSMGAMMMVSMIQSFDRLISGTASAKETAFAVTIAVAMLVSIILFPILNVKYEKKKKKKREEKRQKKYKEYINSKIDCVDKIMQKQRKILFENYLSAEECTEIILDKKSRLWERKIEDPDFLSIRCGIGDVPLEIDMQYPEDKFTLDDDNLVDILNTIVNKSKILKEAPIAISLAEKNNAALVIQNKTAIADQFMQNIIMQLITFQSYEDLKLVFLLKDDKDKKWEYVKMLPHVWDDTKKIRFFADNYDDMKLVSAYLEEEYNERIQYEDERVNYKSFMPYYLIITDDYKEIENLKIIGQISKSKKNIGFGIFCMTHDLMQLPNECKTFISLYDGTGSIFQSEISSTNQQKFKFNTEQTFFFDKIIQKLANIPIKYSSSGSKFLPSSYSFLELYNVGNVEQLNILERWKTNNSTLHLKAPIGVDEIGMPIVLDIHEKFHGPHGLIAGSTGSGKSEFIITYILSLAVNYNPDDVAFVLIDYKGGGLAGAFKKKNIQLPHLVGTITNIDTVGLQRSLDSIQSELRRRQVMFNNARNMTEESTIDIYKYQKLYHDGIVKEPIPHLLIICDEFAELKQQQEDFMDELISVARIGRSLGVHLILATQKPAGIVNEQIRSNSKFGICLKVQEKEDSVDVIKRPDAATLKQAGQFYMQVGNDEYFVLGQSAWSGAQYFPSDVPKKKVSNSLEFISNTGAIIKDVDNSLQKKLVSKGEQLTNIVKYLYDLSVKEQVKGKQLWLDNIPETIYIKDLRSKYNISEKSNCINPVIGEYDDPYNQSQGIVTINLSNEGNTIIYGNADSGKETLLSSIVYDVITTHTVEEAQIYILDFGSEALKIFKGSPHVGDVVFINDVEKLSRFFDMAKKEIKRRKAILSDYNGDYSLYLEKSGKPMPLLIMIMNNYEAFSENYNLEYEDTFLTLTRECIKYGIVFIITTSTFNDLRYRLSQNFKQKITLQLNKEDDYLNIFETIGKKRPSHIFGRGLIKLNGDSIYEFQTAKICKAENWNVHINETIEKDKQNSKVKARFIPVLPEQVMVEDVKAYMKGLTAVPIGIKRNDLEVCKYNFKNNLLNIITSKNIDDCYEFTSNIIQELMKTNNITTIILDAEKVVQSKKNNLNDEFKKLVYEIETKDSENQGKDLVCIIIGIDKFLGDLEGGEATFIKTLKEAEELSNCNFIIVDNLSRLKNHAYDEWYKNNINGDTGIWVGNGVNDQYAITTTSSGKNINNCGRSFGYEIKQGEATLIKLLGIREKSDENE